MNTVVVQGLGAPITAEVAETDEERERGLVGHAPLGPDQGMWFPYAAAQTVEFWMSSLNFAIDMIFCRSVRRGQYEIQKITRNCQPGDLDPIRASNIDGILEVAANRSSMVGAGDVIRVESSLAPAAMVGTGSEPDPSEEVEEKIDLNRPANDPLTRGIARRHQAQDQDAVVRRFLVAFETSKTWDQVREVVSSAATQRAQDGPEADPADRVRTLYEIRIAAANPPTELQLQSDTTIRDRLGRLARKHIDGARFRLAFTEPGGQTRGGGQLDGRTWYETFTAAFEGIRNIDASGVVVSIRLR